MIYRAMRTRRRNREWERELERLQLAVEEAEGEEAVRLAAQLQELDPVVEAEPDDEQAEMDEILESIIAKGAEAVSGLTRGEFESVASCLRSRKRGAEAQSGTVVLSQMLGGTFEILGGTAVIFRINSY